MKEYKLSDSISVINDKNSSLIQIIGPSTLFGGQYSILIPKKDLEALYDAIYEIKKEHETS
jgi:hypothetical protein